MFASSILSQKTGHRTQLRNLSREQKQYLLDKLQKLNELRQANPRIKYFRKQHKLDAKNLIKSFNDYTNVPESVYGATKKSTKTTKTASNTNQITTSTTTTSTISTITTKEALLLSQASGLVDDYFSIDNINYKNLTKGRSVQDTREILDYMIQAYYHINSYINNKHSNTSSTKFLDQSKIAPDKILTDGLFEGDIVLSKSQARGIFSKYLREINSSLNYLPNQNEGRKVIRESVYRWELPIHYCLDRLYCNFI